MKISFRLLLTALTLTGELVAQLAGTPGQTGLKNQPVQLPLSGRTNQSGSVSAVQTPLPGTTTSVNTLNTSIQAQGPYAGSALSQKPFDGKLSLHDAIERGLEYNLGSVGLNQAVKQAKGQQRVARSSLLPNISAALKEDVQQTNLRALGIRFQSPIPELAIPTIVGPFNYFDLRGTLTQTVADMTALNNYRSAKEVSRANQYTASDARDLVVLAVGGAYLQTIAAKARVESARAQLDTAIALYNQTVDRRKVGVSAQIDVNRALVQQETQRQRLSTLENDLAKQKINLARLSGLPANSRYDITDNVPFSAAPPLAEEDAVREAMATRDDLKAAEAQVRAAQKARAAARAERLPSLDFLADYGAIGTNPAQSHGTFTVVGTLRVPVWLGGRTEGDIDQAEAALNQRRAELEDARGRVESDVRNAFLDLQAAASQTQVSLENQKVARETLDLTRQRFEAGVTDSVEVVQSEESVASADLDYITSVFAHNVAKLSLARAIGHAQENLTRYLTVQ
jgi:outer membrane protein TolC